MATTSSHHLVQYIILRKDLIPKGMKASKGEWSWGAIIAQACHASTACLHTFREDSNVKSYLSQMESMHKVILQAPDLPALEAIVESSGNLDRYPWIEQPENVLTAVAFKPYPKETVYPLVAHLKLFR